MSYGIDNSAPAASVDRRATNGLVTANDFVGEPGDAIDHPAGTTDGRAA